jgi:hypothetical protein
MRPTTLHPSSDHGTPLPREFGGIVSGILIAVLILAVVGIGAFYYFGGDANVDVKIDKPDVHVSSSETPGN